MDELKKSIEEALTPTLDTIKSLGERVEKIEKSSIVSVPNVNTISDVYKGRNLSRQGNFIRKAVEAEPHLFTSLRSEEKMNNLMKFFVDVVTKTTLNETTASQGGYLVPEEYQMDLIQLARNTSFALRTARIIPMGTDTLRIPMELTHGATTWEAESATKTADEPTFAEAVLSAKKMFNLAVASNEMLADSALDVSSIIMEQFSYAQGMELDNQMFNGTGSPVSGCLTAKAGYSVVLTGAAAGFSSVSAINLSQAISKLAEGRLGKARFFVNRSAMHFLRSLKDSNNRPIFAEIGGKVPNTMYEYPVNMTESIATTDTTGKPFGVFGNFDYMLIGRRSGAMTIDVDPYSLFTKYQTQFRMVTRWGFDYGDVNAFCRIINA